VSRSPSPAILRYAGRGSGTIGLIALVLLLVGSIGACGSSAETADEVFTDPGGVYRILVPPKWEPTTESVPAGVEAWFVDLPRNGFTANVNVLDTTGVGMELDDYVSMSIDSARELVDGFLFLNDDRFTNGSGDELALMEYRLNDLHVLAVVGVRDDRAVVATFVSREDEYPRLLPEVEPYLRSLELLDTSAIVS